MTTVRLDGAFELPTSPEEAWDALADVRVLARCIPGDIEVELDVVDEAHAHVGMRVRAGFLPVTLRGEIELVDRERPGSFGVRAAAGALGTSAVAAAVVTLAPGAEGTTATWSAEVTIEGPFAGAVSAILEREAPAAADHLAECLRRRLTPDPGAQSADGETT